MGVTDNTITAMRFKTIPILPTVFSDSLSYMETVGQMVAKLNEVIGYVNSFSNSVLEGCKKLSEEILKDGLLDVENTIQEVEDFESRITAKYQELVNNTNLQIQIFSSKIDGVNSRLDDVIVGVNDRTDLAIQQNNEMIVNRLGKFLSEIKIINFFTGESVSVQDMFNYLSYLHTNESITYNHLVDVGFTVSQLENLELSYTDIVLNGASFIM